MYGTPNVISDPEHVALALRLMDEEMATCSLCTKSWKPRHFRPYIRDDTLVGNADCGSNGRRYEPTIGEFIGRPHCTCDICF